MEKIVRISKIEDQDTIRREDMKKMSPSERLKAMIQLRDHLYPYAPLERIASIRKLS
jgi:hypothetical protein